MIVMSQPVAAPASVELEVERIRGLLKERRFQQAVSAAAALRTLYPRTGTSSTCSPSDSGSRVRSRMPSTRSPHGAPSPGASQLYQERGHCYVAIKDAPRAIEAYERAVQINPALPPPGACSRALQDGR